MSSVLIRRKPAVSFLKIFLSEILMHASGEMGVKRQKFGFSHSIFPNWERIGPFRRRIIALREENHTLQGRKQIIFIFSDALRNFWGVRS